MNLYENNTTSFYNNNDLNNYNNNTNYFKMSIDYNDNNKEQEKNEKINKTLENMYTLGNIIKNEIKREKKNNPEKFIETKQALELKNQDQQLFSLGLLSKNLEDIGIETAIEKDNEITDEHDSATTVLEYIMNGYIQKKKYDLHFDFGKQRNEELLKNKYEYEKLKKKLKQKLSKDYYISEDKIIILEP